MITTERNLAHRLDINDFELALAVQTVGVPEFLRSRIVAHGETNVHGRGPDGQAETYRAAFERVCKVKWKKGNK